MSRMAAFRDVWFVEEPERTDGEPTLEVQEVMKGVRVCRPRLPDFQAFGFRPEQEPVLEKLLASALAAAEVKEFVAWLYTPMALHLALALEPKAIVYDCMDELSAFLHAPPELLAMERELLVHADTVFTGGQSLYRAKRDRHADVHCFPSSVDVRHFARARTVPDSSHQRDLPHPRLGFFGVIDERMDLDVVQALAAAHPDWQIVLVGPVVKIDPATLPTAENVHYLGQRPYSELPAFLAGWDVCLMPFAMGPATRFISPTKVLEYMAADRPIVTTPIADVVDPFGEIVYVGHDAASFVAACERALGASREERATRRAHAEWVLAHTSWDDTVRRMDEIVRRLTAEPLPALTSRPEAQNAPEVRA
jgi:UDP-galactopyranose mutase